jgi:hypothetical protein
MPSKMELTTEEWAEEQFGGLDLGDERRTARVVKVAGALAKECLGTLPGSMEGRAELEGAYRLLSNPAVTFGKLQEAHREQVHEACEARGEYLLIEDTTDLNYSTVSPAEGLGWNGNPDERGFLLHTTLAARVESWSGQDEPVLNLLGIFEQRLWTRTHPPHRGEKQEDRLRRRRESERWASAFQGREAPVWGHWTWVADREADIFECFIKCQKAGTHFIIRACKPRVVCGEQADLLTLARGAPVKGQLSVSLRRRAGQPAREALLTLRARTVTIRGPRRPDGRPGARTMQVLLASESGAPEGVAPIEWVLLTDRSCEREEDCRRVVRAYAKRWLIEEYHKVLKTGLKVEESQLETAHGLECLVGILAIVAIRLLRMKLLGRVDAGPVALELHPHLLSILTKKQGVPREGWTCERVLVGIARLGGFLARKGDGDPGWLTIWRGWRRLSALLEGYTLAAAEM